MELFRATSQPVFETIPKRMLCLNAGCRAHFFMLGHSSVCELVCWVPFLAHFRWFFIDFQCQNRPNIYQKSIPKSSQEHINKKLKPSILYCNLQYICALGYVMLCNWRKNDTEILSKTTLKSTPNLDRFCTQLGSILGGFWTPRWSQIRSKSLQKSIFKSII